MQKKGKKLKEDELKRFEVRVRGEKEALEKLRALLEQHYLLVIQTGHMKQDFERKEWVRLYLTVCSQKDGELAG